MSNLIEKLGYIQAELKAPKNQFNKFGGYKYRNCEDILEAVKPLLKKEGLVLLISDDIYTVNDRTYVRADATITDGETERTCYGYAREALTKKGMDESQITGASSSYARKYALNGLFLIDDTKDADNDAPDQEQAKPKKEDPIAKKGHELRAVIQRWCELNGKEPKKIMESVSKRPDFTKSVAYYTKVIAEFEQDIKEKTNE